MDLGWLDDTVFHLISDGAFKEEVVEDEEVCVDSEDEHSECSMDLTELELEWLEVEAMFA